MWVVVGSPTAPRPRGLGRPGGRVTTISVGTERRTRSRPDRVLAMALAAIRMRRAVRTLSQQIHFDAVVYSSISLLWARSPELLPASARRIHLMWDFFPIHHSQVGSIPPIPGINVPLKALERWAIGHPDSVLVMSPRGQSFFQKYFPGVASRFVVQPPWAPDTRHRARLDGGGPLRIIFGGQLVKGRGVDTLIRAIKELENRSVDIELIVAGSGPEEENLQSLISQLGVCSVQLTGQLSRERYSRLLTTAHVGVAITQASVTSPSFPSKIADYARAGLPVLVATESSSDVGSVIEGAGAGLSSDASSISTIATTISKFATLHVQGSLADMGAKSRAFYEAHLSASAAASSIIQEAKRCL